MGRRNRRSLWWLLGAFVVAYGILLVFFQQQTQKFAINEAEKHIEDALLTHRAIHSYVEEIQKPELYRLKREGRLYDDYFSPKVLSFTYIARGIKDYLNQERSKAGVPEVYFKLAAANSRNPVNQADVLEAALLEKMNLGDLAEYRRIHRQDGSPYLYYAMPINANKASCMRCHGLPRNAPVELVKQYGAEAGFFEEKDNIRALISIRVPLNRQLQDARKIFFWLSAVTFLVFAAIFLVFLYFFRKMDHLSSTDVLTGLYNRLKFTDEIQRTMGAARRYGYPFSIIMIDLDHFKRLNDAHGHAYGDNALTRVGRILRQRVRNPDIAARWGGEEFVVACPHTGIAGSTRLAEDLRQAVFNSGHGQGVALSASFGVAEYRSGDALESLMERADAALYRSKSSGRNQVTSEAALEPPRPEDAAQARHAEFGA